MRPPRSENGTSDGTGMLLKSPELNQLSKERSLDTDPMPSTGPSRYPMVRLIMALIITLVIRLSIFHPTVGLRTTR